MTFYLIFLTLSDSWFDKGISYIAHAFTPQLHGFSFDVLCLLQL